MIIGNHAHRLNDFDFVEFRFAPVLSLPWPLRERRTDTDLSVELGAVKIILLPFIGNGVNRFIFKRFVI
jgi:hypothetical protein